MIVRGEKLKPVRPTSLIRAKKAPPLFLFHYAIIQSDIARKKKKTSSTSPYSSKKIPSLFQSNSRFQLLEVPPIFSNSHSPAVPTRGHGSTGQSKSIFVFVPSFGAIHAMAAALKFVEGTGDSNDRMEEKEKERGASFATFSSNHLHERENRSFASSKRLFCCTQTCMSIMYIPAMIGL